MTVDLPKFRLLKALDGLIADMRDATAAIQRDDYDGAIEKFESVSVGIAEEIEDLRRVA